MTKPKTPITSVKIAVFANAELDQLVSELYTIKPSLKITAKEDLVGALVLAARRSPIEAVKAVVQTYWDRERAEVEGLARTDE